MGYRQQVIEQQQQRLAQLDHHRLLSMQLQMLKLYYSYIISTIDLRLSVLRSCGTARIEGCADQPTLAVAPPVQTPRRCRARHRRCPWTRRLERRRRRVLAADLPKGPAARGQDQRGRMSARNPAGATDLPRLTSVSVRSSVKLARPCSGFQAWEGNRRARTAVGKRPVTWICMVAPAPFPDLRVATRRRTSPRSLASMDHLRRGISPSTRRLSANRPCARP